MMLEMVGSRILAPYVGTSIFVWTSLIGIILASLSMGNWVGGKTADKKSDAKIMSLILAISALAVILIAVTNSYILTIIGLGGLSLSLSAVISTLILFTPASILLGMISPFAAKLSLNSTGSTGSVIGTLSALSSLGSIAGTFLAGFFLIAILGSTNLLFLIAFILLLNSLLLNHSDYLNHKVSMTIFLIYMTISNQFLSSRLYTKQLIDKDTQYSRVWIFDSHNETGKAIRVMKINNESSSAMFLDSNELVFDYTNYYRLAEIFKSDFHKTLLIGGAGYSYPKYYLEKYPENIIDVVEIDPMITLLAKEHFDLAESPNLRIYHEDGRIFLNRTSNKYDVVLGDAFKSNTVPFHLTTQEAVSKMYDILTTDGIVIINLIGSMEGTASQFISASYKTYKSVFEQVYLFPLNQNSPKNAQNIILVALKSTNQEQWKSDDPQLQAMLEMLWKPTITDDLPVLTDDFAPVDFYTRNVGS